MNCNGIAPYYELLEKLAYGRRLQECRVRRLGLAGDTRGRQRVLILGDGNGRFTRELVRRYPEVDVDSVEMSEGMIAEAAKRGVTLKQGDAFTFPLEDGAYDLAFTHFFLDCFNDERVIVLAARVKKAMAPGGRWVVSEFREAGNGWRGVYTRALLKVMYGFFALATGVETRKLPDYEAALRGTGLRMESEWVSWDGLLRSEVWEDDGPAGVFGSGEPLTQSL